MSSERSLDFDWDVAPPAPAARFTTRITPRFSENYRFTVQSDDRVQLMVDGKPLVDEVALIAGHTYELIVRYAQSSDTPSLRVTWESDSQSSFVVPHSASHPRRRAVSPP